jgi:hypothetical protein
MPNWIDEQVARERYHDIVREERQQRMVAVVLESRRRLSRRSARFYNPVLARFGRWLVAWGCSLETRYGAIVEPPIAANTRGNLTGC